MTEKPVQERLSLRSPPARDGSREVTTFCGQEAPYNQQQGAFHIVDDRKSTANAEVANDSDFDLLEALSNFQAYLDILREWDDKEKAEEESLSSEEVR